MKRLFEFFAYISAVMLMTAYNLFAASPFGAAPLSFAITSDETKKKSLDEQIAETLESMNKRLGKMSEIEEAVAKNRKGYDEVLTIVAEVQKQMGAIQRLQVQLSSTRQRIGRPDTVSDACARHLGALSLVILEQKGQYSAPEGIRVKINDILGVEHKTALGSSDFALSQEWNREVLELVANFGFARRYGTVFPLGAAAVKLPRLKTSPAFGLIGLSAAIGEKSPQIEFVNFVASKWGGMIRIPSEIDDGSIVDLGQFIARYAARETAKIEDAVFFLADGSGTYDSLSGLNKLVVDNTKVVQQASTKTKYSDLTLAVARSMRAIPDSAVLGTSGYMFHPTFEQLFSGFNTAGDKPYLANGINGASLDGFPIRWVDTMPAYSTAANVSKVFGLFGDPSYHYLAPRGGMRFDKSVEAGFSTDETLIRCLERFTTGLMALGAVAGVQTAAS